MAFSFSLLKKKLTEAQYRVARNVLIKASVIQAFMICLFWGVYSVLPFRLAPLYDIESTMSSDGLYQRMIVVALDLMLCIPTLAYIYKNAGAFEGQFVSEIRFTLFWLYLFSMIAFYGVATITF